MHSSISPSDYMIYSPEKLRFSDVSSSLLSGRSLVGSELTKGNNNGIANPMTVVTWILQKFLIWFSTPLAHVGRVIEFTLNLFSLNGGGLFSLLVRLVTGRLVFPRAQSADYRSFAGHIDGRTELFKNGGELNPLDLCMMASKIVYENKAYVKNVVNNIWKMYFVGHYNFWNEGLKNADTQAFICCDRQENAQLILVAFRGTEIFNGRDWATDVDLSWMSMGEMGRVHVGFMKALGLLDEKDYKKGWPIDYTGSNKLAYYGIRDTLKALLQQHPSARILVTGHSLGGALAILFPSILVLHQEDEIMSKLMGVYTFGQPRVGDKVFGKCMRAQLNVVFKRYHRVVFRYDIVPRVPFDDPISQFAHFGGCVYYRNWYKGEVMKEEQNPNYFNPMYMPSKYFNAMMDMLRGVFAGMSPGRDYKESSVSFIWRTMGIIIPGVGCHSPRDYVNAARLGKIVIQDEEDEDEGKIAGF